MSKILSVTPRALEKLKALVQANGAEGIRIGVRSGGCSGFSYIIDYARGQSEFDELIDLDEVRILIDKKAILFLAGTEMDYIEEQFSSGFVFANPLEKAKCGCGKSFSI